MPWFKTNVKIQIKAANVRNSASWVKLHWMRQTNVISRFQSSHDSMYKVYVQATD